MRKPPGWLYRFSWALVAIALLVGGCSGQDGWTGVERIVAVGDVHGDYDQFVRTLRAAEVVDEQGNWIAGKTHLVQVGDVLDRGPDSRKAMDLLMKLERQAARAGGAVHALIGNHEAMVLLGDLRYVHPGEIAALGGPEGFRKAMSPQGKYGRWICSHNAVVKINDVLFVHAGLSPSYAGLPLAQINKAVREQLAKGEGGGMATDPAGPLWDRTLALGQGDEFVEELERALTSYGASRMVVGHTFSTEGVLSRAGGRLIRIDVGMCRHYGGPAACLVIEKGVLYEVRHPKTRRELQPDRRTKRPAAQRDSTPARRKAA